MSGDVQVRFCERLGVRFPGPTHLYHLAEKYAKVGKSETNPFIDHAGYLAYIDEKERDFNKRLAEQKAAGGAAK